MTSLVPAQFLEATSGRRSLRKLSNESTVPDSAILELAEQAILTVPSAFNNQTCRITVLLGASHEKLWSITGEALLNKIGEERFNKGTKEKMEMFSASHGSILFWDDSAVIEQYKEDAPEIYKDKTDDWIHQSSGMHQYFMWTALSALGLGANVQHYNPLIDDKVKQTWGIPSGWLLRTQMVFGKPLEEAKQKEQKFPMKERLQVFTELPKGSKSEL